MGTALNRAKVKKAVRVFILFLLPAMSCPGQDDNIPFKAWQLMSYSGQIRGRGTYRETQSNGEGNAAESYFTGLFQLRSQSYIIHPNFMLLNFGGTYNPESTRSSFIGVPDYAEKTNSQGLDISALFFRKKPYNLTTSANFNDAIINVENLSRIRSKGKTLGATFNYGNKVLPFTLSYTKQTSDQNSLGTNRTFNLDQGVFQATANKSFSRFDNTSFNFVQTQNTSNQNDPAFLTPLHIVNNINVISLTNALTFDRKKNYTLSSSVSNSDQTGSFHYKRLFGQEYLTVKLPKRFMFYTTYAWGQTQQDLVSMNNQNLQCVLSHQLYESLTSRLIFEHRQNDQSAYSELRDRGGVDLKYVKKIPQGKLSIAYTYYKEQQAVTTPSILLTVLREEYLLTDGVVTIFKNEYVNIRSVLVRDITGAIIYQPNIDYILVDKNPYLEIIRVPGGMIPNGGAVYIDYTAMRPGLYKYNSNINNLYADVYLFKNILNTYYRLFTQDFDTRNQVENLVLNTYVRQIAGSRINLNYLRAGVEYEQNKSNLLPYYGMSYNLYAQKLYKRFFFSFNTDWRDMQMSNEGTRREDVSVSFKMAYTIWRNMKLDVDYMYRTMRGRGLDMEVQTARMELTATMNRLYFSVGSDMYLSRNYSTSMNYKGTYVQLTRSF
ncbi:MAG: hypothetical protein ACHQRM_12235 [Bacteroidia bacterium]